MKRLFFIPLAAIFLLTVTAAGLFAQNFPGNDNNRPFNTRESVRRAVEDLLDRFGDDYAKGEEYLARLDELDKEYDALGDTDDTAWNEKFDAFRREALLANPATSSIPIIFVTAIINKEDVRRNAGQIGGRTFLAKPVKIEDLIEKINAL